MTLIIQSVNELLATVGRDLPPTDWMVIEQSRIDLFSDATDDHQWIHVEGEPARQGPFGAPIAHGYLILALVSRFLPQLIAIRGATMGINYGCDRVRFPSVVRAGARIRGRGEIISTERVTGGAQVKIRVTIEVEGSEKPSCVVDTLSRWYFE